MRQFKGNNAYGSGGAAAGEGQMVPPVKLPRTGIEQVFCGDRPRFIETHREFERIASVNVSTLTLLFSGQHMHTMKQADLQSSQSVSQQNGARH